MIYFKMSCEMEIANKIKGSHRLRKLEDCKFQCHLNIQATIPVIKVAFTAVMLLLLYARIIINLVKMKEHIPVI